MSEHQQPTPTDPPTDAERPDPRTSGPGPETSPTEPDTPHAGTETVSETVSGRRVTTRSVDRREVTEYTQETITEDIPLEAYQGPGSTHPAPVG